MSSISAKQEYLLELITVAKILFAVDCKDGNKVLKSNCLGICLSNKNIFKILAGGQSKQPAWGWR